VPGKLEGKVAVVTGGTEGIGRRGEPDEVAKGGFVSGVG
jgi:NAD(P)-dependent dehydrogenase (short-subunit alcohol dehydrogenase family)